MNAIATAAGAFVALMFFVGVGVLWSLATTERATSDPYSEEFGDVPHVGDGTC